MGLFVSLLNHDRALANTAYPAQYGLDLGRLDTMPPHLCSCPMSGDVEIDSRKGRIYVLDLDEGLAVFEIAVGGDLVPTVDPPMFVSDFTEAFVLTSNDAHVYASEGFADAIYGFRVRGNGRPRMLNRSPFSGDFAIELLQPEGTRTLYTVGRETRRIGALEIEPNGRLTAPEFFDVTDEDGRMPTGAAFFDDPVPSGGIPE